MKSLKYILIAILIIIMIYSSISCAHKSIDNQKTIVLQTQCKSFPKELLSESSRIMVKRLKALNIINFTVEEDTYQSQLVFKFDSKVDVQFLSEILPVQGRVNFLETYKRDDVLDNLRKGLNSECNRTLDSLLSISKDKFYPNAIIGQAEVKDTFAISKFFRSKAVKSMLPPSIKFCWSKLVSDSNKLHLYAVSSVDNGISVASLEELHTSKENEYITVSMSFKQEYWKDWENLTKKSIDKAVAFVIDDRVYSSPIVKSIISGGKIEITGSFSEMEANRLVVIASCGELPLEFHIK